MPKRIAVFRFGHIGDTIVGMPALWTIRKHYKEDTIIYLTQDHLAKALAQGTEVLRDHMVYDEVFSYTLGPKGVSLIEILKVAFSLRRKKIDFLIYLPPRRTARQLGRDKLFFKLAGIKNVKGIDSYDPSLVHNTDARPIEVVHEADRLLNVLRSIDIPVAECPAKLMEIGITPEERKFAADFLEANFGSSKKLKIGIGPGSKMESKRWAIDRFVSLTKRIEADHDVDYIVFGSKAEHADCEQIAAVSKHAFNAAGAFTVRQSTAVLELCDIYIGNDTGTMHLAASAGVKCIGIFAARDWPGRWNPYGEGHIVHRESVPCEGCMLEVCDKDNLCLQLISVDAVFASAKKLLAEIAGQREKIAGSQTQ